MPFNFISIFRKIKREPKIRQKTRKKNVSKKQIQLTLTMFLPIASVCVSTSTSENYKTAVRSFIRFNNGADILLALINADMMKQYELWLRKRGVCPNTSSCYMRSLRAIYNKAVAKRQIPDKKPFSAVFSGNEKTQKRSVDINDIRRIQSLSLPDGSVQALTRDLFLFSFYAMGMPFIDMAYLKKSRIKDGILTYYRHKTGRQIRIKLEKCMSDIISKYENRHTDYIFPIICITSNQSKERSYGSALSCYNRTLKTLSQKAGIKRKLTSYVARHSWASIAYGKNIELSTISKALGHADTQVTLTYINDINDTQLTKANKKILKEIFPPLCKR